MTSVSRDAFTTAKPANPPDPFAGRAAPYSVEAEQAVLCAMLQSSEAVPQGSPRVARSGRHLVPVRQLAQALKGHGG